MKQKHTKVVARDGRGSLLVVDDDLPSMRPGDVLIEVHRSLVSPGTELRGGWTALARERERPDSLDKPRPIGYSNAGRVLEVGTAVSRIATGMRVAAIGSGFARHAQYAVVPQNLVFPLPDEVSYEQGAFAMLAATALHALRRTGPQLGEYVAVVGLGILGQLCSQLFRIAGAYVIGWDLVEKRTAVARACGVDRTCVVGADDPVAATREFTRGAGLDAAVVAIAGEATSAIRDIENSMKRSPDGHKTGIITIVGGIHLDYAGETTNIDYRRASRTGPGYHDDAWEQGAEYPPVFVRWNTRTNIELCLRLMSEGRLEVDRLVTHRIPIAECRKRIAEIIERPEEILGVVFQMR